MLHLHRREKCLFKSPKLILIGLFSAIGLAIANTIWALYMEGFGLTHSEIGFISSLFVIIALFFSLYSTPIMQKFKETKIYVLSLIIAIISYLMMSFFNTLLMFLIFATILTISSVFRANTFDLIFRDNTKDKDLNKREGLLYAFRNLGWLIGPLIASYLLIYLKVSNLFLVSGIFFFITLIFFLIFKIKNIEKERKKIDINIFKNLRSFIKKKNLRINYLVTMGISLWWGFVYIYVPLFMLDNGLTGKDIGIFLALIIIPLAIFEYPIGKLSGKIGTKTFLVFGFIGLTIASLILFVLNNIYIQLLIIIIASIFAACIEPTQETFFFNRIKKNDEEKLYPIFTTSWHSGSFIGKILVAGVLLFLANNYAYLAIGLLMGILAILAMRIKE